ncbi:hypothetical protein EVAR_81225_1 [Eumeta japonica]|uniref:Uncharacterized protein n=1 Tax=Eumeta variegata TaxID=151549 RepID=A0A4C1V0W5_EUMVA|nr:hypothetical protein EVAR_81225_1 [Eumeta japonica]
MLLNLRKLYMNIVKKSQTVTTSRPDTTSTTALDIDCAGESSRGSASITHHCRTCTCNQSLTVRNEISGHKSLSATESEATNTSSSSNRSVDSQDDEEGIISNDCSKQLNFKEEAIIYDEEQLERSRMNAASVCTPKHENKSDIKEKNNIFLEQDVPVIYDENQLNLGRSPIVEEKSLTQDLSAGSMQNNERLKQNRTNVACAFPSEYEKGLANNNEKIQNVEKNMPVLYDENQLNMSGGGSVVKGVAFDSEGARFDPHLATSLAEHIRPL